MELLKEIILFLLYLPCYFKQFLKGLRIFSESYTKLLYSLEEKQKSFNKTDLEKFKDTKEATKFIENTSNEILRLQIEHEKMFNQLFSIFVAMAALIISIIALITK